MDDVAADALRLPGDYFRAPPVICYLDRNHGAAIRRAFTRLRGGGENPVAVISVPRERMIGSGIASSLVHEAGHQGAALLKLVPSLRSALREKQDQDPEYRQAWTWFDKWISEIIADFWSVARIGIGSTQGLMAVVSLPRPMVFLLTGDDPHPIPWLRVKSEIEKWSSRRRFSARHRKEPTRTCRFGPGSNSNEGATTPAARPRVTLPRPSPVEANAFHEHQRADSIFETPRAAPPQLPLQKLPLRHQAKLDDCSLVPHDD